MFLCHALLWLCPSKGLPHFATQMRDAPADQLGGQAPSCGTVAQLHFRAASQSCALPLTACWPCAGNLVMSAVAHVTGVSTDAQLRSFGAALYGLFAVLLAGVTAYLFAVWRRLAT